MEAGAYNYILICGDGIFYTGNTPNLTKGLIEHQRGEVLTIAIKRPPLELAFTNR